MNIKQVNSFVRKLIEIVTEYEAEEYTAKESMEKVAKLKDYAFKRTFKNIDI